MHLHRSSALLLVLLTCLTTPGSRAWGIEVIAHRGCNQLAPENTSAAAQKCIELGIDYIEVDVMSSRDGILYNMHDPSVNRTTNGKGLVSSLTSKEVDALDAGSWFGPRFKGEKVPRYDTFLPWLKGKIKINFDIKLGNLEQLIRLVRDNKMEGDCFFHPSNPAMALRFHQLAPDLTLKVDVSTPEEAEHAVTAYGAKIVETTLPSLTPAFQEICRKYKLKVICCAIEDNADEYRRIIASGADMAMVNRPDLFLQVESTKQ